MRYEVYVKGVTNPVWTYVKPAYLKRRLDNLARYSGLAWVQVDEVVNGRIARIHTVSFSKGWTAEPEFHFQRKRRYER